MKKGIIDPTVQNEHIDTTPDTQISISEELQNAIQNLIYRMRERGPVQSF
jgi:hypothetical protein